MTLWADYSQVRGAVRMARTRVLSAAILMACGTLIPVMASGVPTQMTYQGQMQSGGNPYTGLADMKFVILSGMTSLWSNDSTSVAGSPPTSSVSVNVSGGVFTVLLGSGS